MVRGMKRLMAFFVVFTLLFQMTDMPLHAENSRDVSALLTVKEAYIEQNHKDVVENSMLTDTDPVSVSVNFKVPVLGDGLTEEDSYVRKGDTAVIELATKYKLADTASPSFALTRKVEENAAAEKLKSDCFALLQTRMRIKYMPISFLTVMMRCLMDSP